MVSSPLTLETLTSLRELTLYENLTPRFSATVPSSWSEIQQEQQQRRHPQHLHRHGETNRHTRSWKLQQDANSWDEHVFEIVLPRVTSLGHVDIKFSLHQLCTTPPRIQVSLCCPCAFVQSLASVLRTANLVCVDNITFKMFICYYFLQVTLFKQKMSSFTIRADKDSATPKNAVDKIINFFTKSDASQTPDGE